MAFNSSLSLCIYWASLLELCIQTSVNLDICYDTRLSLGKGMAFLPIRGYTYMTSCAEEKGGSSPKSDVCHIVIEIGGRGGCYI